MVTVNHRLGPFGYMAHPALTAESEHNASGNYGQLDLIAALQWVQENIDRFDGDPEEYAMVSSLSLDLWASFAKDGDPAIDRQPWPAYTAENDTYLRINLLPEVQTGLGDAFPELDLPEDLPDL